jgi:hypothetical protein
MIAVGCMNTHTHKTRVQSGSYFFLLFFPFFVLLLRLLWLHAKKMREHIGEKKISRIDYMNVVESERKVMFFNVFMYEKHSSTFVIDFYDDQDRYYQHNILVLNKVLSIIIITTTTTTHAKEKKS